MLRTEKILQFWDKKFSTCVAHQRFKNVRKIKSLTARLFRTERLKLPFKMKRPNITLSEKGQREEKCCVIYSTSVARDNAVVFGGRSSQVVRSNIGEGETQRPMEESRLSVSALAENISRR